MEKDNINILAQYADASARVKYLRKSISKLEERLLKFKTTDYGMVSDTVTKGKKGRKPLGTVKVTGFRFKEYSKAERNLRARKILLKNQEEELLELLCEVEKFIEGIENIELRNILSLYYIEDMTWIRVAHTMNELYKGKDYTPESCRKKHERFFDKN